MNAKKQAILDNLVTDNQAERWFNKAQRTKNWESGLPRKTGTLEEGTVTVHEFPDGSEILSGHGTVWTREEYESL